ncbi:BID domain-containing T4SS effector [Bartonella phoceensis]|uniref:BID domain-containing T4SS effector n=1 Tax=Bartonella phoceensis TaxID=270249 RepID=UPI001ABAA282|nr:BID domain-containing T4SS effector [Bartonella phoceensis]
MKKNQQYSSSQFFIEELRQLYGQLIVGTSTAKEHATEERHIIRDSDGELSYLSEVSLAHKVWRDPQIMECAQSIVRLSKAVYGNGNVFQKEMRDILKNPARGDEISWRFAVKPESFHKLAGINACGLKNRTRTNAEQSITPLCSALEQYTQMVVHKRDQLLSQTQQKSGEQSAECATPTQPLQKLPYRAERGKGPLVNSAVIEMLPMLSSVRMYEEQIKFWCTKVYGNANILTKTMMDIRENPATGDDLLRQVKNNVESIHKLSGIKICGFKNKTRKNAESSITSLCNNIKLYTDVVRQAKEHIAQSHETRQERYSASEVTQNIHPVEERHRTAPQQECSRAIKPVKTVAFVL